MIATDHLTHEMIVVIPQLKVYRNIQKHVSQRLHLNRLYIVCEIDLYELLVMIHNG